MREAIDLAGKPGMGERASDPGGTIAPLPRVSIQAFCETPDMAAVVEEAATDRRMAKAHVKAQMGGATAASEAYRGALTPNVLVLEASSDKQRLLDDLDKLAEVCDPSTRVVVVGRFNDVHLYRELVRRGVSDYMIAPVSAIELIRGISELFNAAGAQAVGRTIAVLGTKGGVGSSTVAHNLGFAISRDLDVQTVIADLDLGFGTVALDFDQDPPQGIAEAVYSPDRLDVNLVDRLLSKCSEKLSLLAAPAMLDRNYDFEQASFDGLVDILRSTIPCTVLDIPHLWTSWARHLAVTADEVVIVAGPDLASFRNVKNIVQILKQGRRNDNPPRLVLNMVGIPKRPELSAADFQKVLEMEPSAVIGFDSQLFGTAMNNGRMVLELQPKGKATETFIALAHEVMGKSAPKAAKKSLLAPILTKLKRGKA
jgi:pilus assembly protein CpaE